MYTPQQIRDMDTLRYMLAELLERQSSLQLTEEQREWHIKGICALKAAMEAIETQAYA